MSKVGEEYGIGRGRIGSLGGNGGEIMGCGHGGRGLKWRARAAVHHNDHVAYCQFIDMTNVHALITECQK
jgi:hypothetical protein